MGCLYEIEIDGKPQRLTLNQLTKHYYKTTGKLKNKKIFSTDEIQDSTIKEVGSILTSSYRATFLTEEDIQRLQLAGKTDEEIAAHVDKSTYVGAYNFISKSNEVLKSLGAPSDRLAPEYIRENRIINYIKQKASVEDNVPALSNTDPELAMFSKSPELSYIAQDVVNYYLLEIKDIMEFEEKTKEVGVGIHSVMSALIRSDGSDTSALVTQALDNMESTSKEILEAFQKDWRVEILRIAKEIHADLNGRGRVLSEVFIAADPNAEARIMGNLDAVVIDPDGNPHIFDFKVSKSPYKEWDSAKLLTTDWQLALYKQLLGQHTGVGDTTLNVVGIHLKKESGGYSINYNTASRSAENKSLHPTGAIHTLANRLVPISNKIAYDPEKGDNLRTTLNTLFPDYKIRTTNEKNDLDAYVTRVVKQWRNTGKMSFFNSARAEGLDKGEVIISPLKENNEYKTEEEMIAELTEKATIYLKFRQENQYRNVAQLRAQIMEIMSDPNKNTFKSWDTERDTVMNRTFKNYLNGNHKLVKGSEELVELGVILFENKRNGKISLVSITSNNLKAAYSNELNYAELEYVKAFAFLNEFHDDLDLGHRKIEEIIALNYEGRAQDPKPLSGMFDLYNEQITAKGIKTRLTNNNLNSVLDTTKNAIDKMFRIYSGVDKKELGDVLEGFFTKSFNEFEMQELLQLQKGFLEAFPDINANTTKPSFDFNNEKEYIYALLQTLILEKSGNIPEGDFLDMDNFSVSFSDFKSVFAALYSKNQDEHDKAGRKILGLIGGLKTITPDKVLSRDLRNINKVLASANLRIGQKLYKQSTVVHKHSVKFYEGIGYTSWDQNLWGRTQEKHMPLFETLPNGEINPVRRLKNPYIQDLKNKMTDAEREYAKQILFEIQKYMLNLTDAQISKANVSSLDSIKKSSPEIFKAIEDGTYFRIPLVRSERVDRYGKVIEGGIKGVVQRSKEYFGEIYDSWDPRELSPDELKSAKDAQLGVYEMYDVYSRQSDEFKKEIIEGTEERSGKGNAYYEFNLDTIAHRVAFSKIRKNILDHRLPLINSYLWFIKLHGAKMNTDITKQFEYVTDRLNLAAYDEPIIDPEMKDAVSSLSLLKRITTAGMLAFRPVLMAKELTIGLFKGFNIASSKMFGRDLFGVKDLAKAVGKLATIDKKFSPEWNLIDGINNYYMFANMDVNTISKKLQTNRRGAFLGLSRWMYATSTLPDYYNRLALFLAKMIHDGSYEAHSLVDGYIQYDPMKDERFAYYFKNRDSNRNSSGTFIPSKNDVKYNKQRNTYLILMDDINKERKGEESGDYKEEDSVDQAYSGRERHSFKTLTDTSYGYYDKDAQATLHNMAFGKVFMQFLQFWPGKMQLWFGKPPKNMEDPKHSPMSQLVQKSMKDKDGNTVLMWKKPIYKNNDPEDEIIEFEHTTTDTGDPLLEWKGSPEEGLMYSILYTVQDVAKGNWTEAVSNKERMARVQFAMVDSLMMMILFGIITAMFKAWIDENGTEGIDGNTMQFFYEVDRRILSESNVYKNTLGAIRSEPAFYSFATQIATDIQDVMTGNKGINQAISHNVKALELWDPQKL